MKLKKRRTSAMLKYLAAITLVTAVWFHGNYHGKSIERLEWQKTVQTATDKARKDEQRKQELVNALSRRQYDELAGINTGLLHDLDGLRNRPPRNNMPADTRTVCEGSTGRELSEPDAGFLTREAARADTLRTALDACYRYADSLRP